MLLFNCEFFGVISYYTHSTRCASWMALNKRRKKNKYQFFYMFPFEEQIRECNCYFVCVHGIAGNCKRKNHEEAVKSFRIKIEILKLK